MERRKTTPGSISHAFALAIPPTVTVLAITAVLQLAGHGQLLFSPLAASAFLIYRVPRERANGVAVVVAAQCLAAVAGALAAAAFHPSFLAEALAMLVTTTILILTDMLHAPAIPTSLLFAGLPVRDDHIGYFFSSVALLAILCVVQRRLNRRFARRTSVAPP